MEDAGTSVWDTFPRFWTNYGLRGVNIIKKNLLLIPKSIIALQFDTYTLIYFQKV